MKYVVTLDGDTIHYLTKLLFWEMNSDNDSDFRSVELESARKALEAAIATTTKEMK